MSSWTIFLIVLSCFALYWAVLGLLKIAQFVYWLRSLFSSLPSSSVLVTIEDSQREPSRTRLEILQSGNIHPQYRIEYADVNGEITERDIYLFKVDEPYLECWCFKADDRRTFRIDRLLAATDISTGQPINDLRAHWRKHK